ncbi:MAG TPA: peptidylprolyl isomerase [Verrucomicrobiota bacterium]|nr:peptidylprolyl isomerase [Verrucomicrobiota bacterium]
MKSLFLCCITAVLSALASSVSVVADEPKTKSQDSPKPAESKPASAATFDNPSKLTEKAPETFKVKFETTQGSFTVEVTRSLAPNGADRFYNLVRSGYFTDIAFFRVIQGFMCQFGIHGDPKIAAAWRVAQIPDDPVKTGNARGTITFATAGPNTRTTQFFINFGDNSRLDDMGFSPFGKVIQGMDVVDKIYNGYGEGAPRGRGPDQGRIQMEGNAYLKKDFPNLDYIKSAVIIPATEAKPVEPKN